MTAMTWGTGGKNEDYFVIIMYSTLPMKDIVLLESGLGIAVNMYHKH